MGLEAPDSDARTTRRRALAAGLLGLGGAMAGRRARAEAPIAFGLTPVFLDSDIQLLAALEAYLGRRMARPVTLVKRRTYQEITAMLLSEQLAAAWICGFPLIQYPERLALVAVPLWRGLPLYRSYLIVSASDPAQSFADLKGQVHAFSDPDSNSGFLVTRHLLATLHERPETYFARTFFAYGHRNVIRAVASGLAQSGSVDGYVWEVMREIEPKLTAATRIVRQSELLGFPPIACATRLADSPEVASLSQALLTMAEDAEGREILQTLRLDGFIAGGMSLFAAIAAKYREVQGQT